jgi:hypothetical protein
MKMFAVVLMLALGENADAQTLPAYLPADGLVGWWPFNGNAGDSSGKGNHGVSYNASLSFDRFNRPNNAYSFNGNNSRIEIPDAASLRCRKISISVWVRPNSVDIGQLIYKGSMNADGEAYSVNGDPSAGVKINSNCVAAVGWQGASYREPLIPGVWEHLVVTFDSTTMKFYRNGVLDTSATVIGLIDNCAGGNLRFGFNHLRYFASTGDGFDGLLDDIGIWNRALNEVEIHQLFTSTITTYGNIGINVYPPLRNLHVRDVIRLEPRDTAPDNPGKGDIYFDGVLNKLRVYDGTVWQNCW